MSLDERAAAPERPSGHLGRCLSENRQELLQRWAWRVLADPAVPSASKLPAPLLQDHMPELLDRVVARLLRRSASGTDDHAIESRPPAEVARTHATQRLALHYSASEALRELAHLRGAALDCCADHRVEPGPESAKLLHFTVDEVMVASALAFERASVAACELAMGAVAHELRNPLGAVLGLARGLEQGQVGSGKAAEGIARSAQQMDRLVQDLLTYSKLEAGVFSIDADNLDAREIQREVCEWHDAAAKRRRVRLACTVPASPVLVRADRMRLVQAVGNLVGNAIKFTPAGKGVGLELVPEDDQYVFRVTDGGPGVAREHTERIFRPFWQAPGAAKASGAGLGLSIARGIVEAHGGTIAVANPGEAGAIFVVTLPRIAAHGALGTSRGLLGPEFGPE
ncbi:MAG: sensor histidine kinase [Myxococcales bacterium]|nr:sensor histidine kinase [Myxococcales bacterium]